MKTKTVSIERLKYAPYNPRKIKKAEFEKLKRSIEKFGYVAPIIWNRATGHVVGGNQRLKALKELGYEEVEVVEVEMSLEEEKALNIALNKISGEWDFPILKEVLESLDMDLQELTGWDSEEIDAIINDFVVEELPDNFDETLNEEKDGIIIVLVKVPVEDEEEFKGYLKEKGYEFKA